MIRLHLARPMALALLALLATHALAAQESAFPTTPKFQAIIRLAQDGRSDSARAMIAAVLKATKVSDPSYAEALYTSATIAASGDEARLGFSRIAVEFPRSAWGDKAMLRLAQLDYGAGDGQGTINRVEQLMTRYPDSGVYADAALWGARAALEKNDVARACLWLDRGLDRVGTNVELRNQIEFTRRRCAQVPRNPSNDTTALKTPELRPEGRTPVQPATTPPLKTPERRPVGSSTVVAPVTPPPPPPAARPATGGSWRVQVAAISDPAAIDRLERAIRALGLTAYRSAAPGGLTRVQAGPFDSREAAAARVGDLTRATGGQPFVTQAP